MIDLLTSSLSSAYRVRPSAKTATASRVALLRHHRRTARHTDLKRAAAVVPRHFRYSLGPIPLKPIETRLFSAENGSGNHLACCWPHQCWPQVQPFSWRRLASQLISKGPRKAYWKVMFGTSNSPCLEF